MLLLVVVVVVVRAGGSYCQMKKSWRGVAREGAAPPPHALAARNALQMSTWRSFVVSL